jgi:hypothetical protein
MAVTFEQTPTGIRISRTFHSLSAAAAGASALEAIAEAAYAPNPFPPPTATRELTPAAAALIERGDEEAPLSGLTAGKAFLADFGPNPVSQSDEE